MCVYVCVSMCVHYKELLRKCVAERVVIVLVLACATIDNIIILASIYTHIGLYSNIYIYLFAFLRVPVGITLVAPL